MEDIKYRRHQLRIVHAKEHESLCIHVAIPNMELDDRQALNEFCVHGQLK